MKLKHLLQAEHSIPLGRAAATLTEERPDWKQTLSGRAILVASPSPADVSLLDMAYALSMINRYDGHTLYPWNVAAHSALATALLRQDMDDAKRRVEYGEVPDGEDEAFQRLADASSLNLLDVLLHDGHEYVLGDLTNPVAQAMQMRLPGFRTALAALKQDWDYAIYDALGIPAIEHGSNRQWLVKRYDFRALYIERDLLMTDPPAPWVDEANHKNLVAEYPFAETLIAAMLQCDFLQMGFSFLVTLDEVLNKVAQEHPDIQVDSAQRQVALAQVQFEHIAKVMQTVAMDKAA